MPEYLGTIFIPSPIITEGGNVLNDIKVYQNHAYVTSEIGSDGGVGITIFDLTALDGMPAVEPGSPAANLTATDVYQEEGYIRAHNLAINEDTGFAYIFSAVKNAVDDSEFVSGSIIILDLKGSKKGHNRGFSSPKEVAQINQRNADDGVVIGHDGQAVTYNGPDTFYRNREILLTPNVVFLGPPENAADTRKGTVSIFDVSDKNDIKRIAYIELPDSVLVAHNGWLSDDMDYFFVGDENFKTGPDYQTNTKVYILDIKDLDSPKLVQPFEIVSGPFGVYPFFDSGTIAVSDPGNGLFLLKHEPEE